MKKTSAHNYISFSFVWFSKSYKQDIIVGANSSFLGGLKLIQFRGYDSRGNIKLSLEHIAKAPGKALEGAHAI